MDSKQVEFEARKAGTQVKRGLKHALAIGCYNSTTDDEIGRSKEHAKHMRRTRRRNFATKMNLIDPHYGKKAAAVLGAGTLLGLAATTVPTVGVALGPTVGGAIIAGGLAYIETDAHRKVGDHALLDSLLDDRGDNLRTNGTLLGYDGVGDRISSFDLAQVADWSDSDDEEFASLLPPSLGGRATEFGQDSEEMDPRSEPQLTDAFDLLGLGGGGSGGSNEQQPSNRNDPMDFFSLGSSGSASSSKSVPNSSAQKTKVASSGDFFDLISAPEQTKPAKPAYPSPPSPEMSRNASGSHAGSSAGSVKPSIQLAPPAPPKDDFFATMLETAPLQPSKSTPSNSMGSSDSSSNGIPEQISVRLQQNAARSPIQTPTQNSPQLNLNATPGAHVQQQPNQTPAVNEINFFAMSSTPSTSLNPQQQQQRQQQPQQQQQPQPQQQQQQAPPQSAFFSVNPIVLANMNASPAPSAQAVDVDPFADLYLRATGNGSSPAGSFDATKPLF